MSARAENYAEKVRAMNNFVQRQDVQEIVDGLGDHAEQFAGKSVLITGGLGFLGRYFWAVLEHLNATTLKGREVHVMLVDSMIACGAAVPPERDSKFVQFFKKDMSELDVPKYKVDFALHCAGIASPFYYRQHPLETIDAAMSVRNTLEIAKANPGCRVVFFSSSEIYGNPDAAHVPTRESYNGNVSCLGPRSVYDESKRLGETLVRAYNIAHGVPGMIVRPFNVVGPGMQHTDYRVLPNFAARLVKGEPLQAYGDGKQTRTYCYVSDAIEGFLRVLLLGSPGEPYNIGNPSPELSVLQFAERVSAAFGSDLKVDVVEHPDTYPADEPQRRCPDITKAREQIGYQPRVPLEEGLRRFAAWAQENYPR